MIMGVTTSMNMNEGVTTHEYEGVTTRDFTRALNRTASGDPKSAGERHTANASKFILLTGLLTTAAAQSETFSMQERAEGERSEMHDATLCNCGGGECDCRCGGGGGGGGCGGGGCGTSSSSLAAAAAAAAEVLLSWRRSAHALRGRSGWSDYMGE